MNEINALYHTLILKLMEDRKIPPKEVYLSADVKKVTFYNFINGENSISVERFGRICAALGLDLEGFLKSGGELPCVDEKGSAPIPCFGSVEAGRTNGFVDIEITKDSLKDVPKVSASRERLKKGLRGGSLLDVVALTVRGDSMEPLFQEDDVVFVHQNETLKDLRHRDIVVMDLDGLGSYTIKQWHKEGLLVALNPKHDAIVLKKCPGWRLFGRVIGMDRVY